TNLPGDIERFFNWNRAALDALSQRFAIDEFQHQELAFTGFVQSINGRDVRMIQRRQHAGFALESSHTFAVLTEGFRKKLDGDTAAQLCVSSLIHVAHSA